MTTRLYKQGEVDAPVVAADKEGFTRGRHWEVKFRIRKEMEVE